MIGKLKGEKDKLYSFANVYRKFNLSTIIKSIGFGNELINKMIEQEKPIKFNIKGMMVSRSMRGFTMPSEWINEQYEKELLANKNVAAEDVKVNGVHPMTIEDTRTLMDLY